MGKPKKQTTTRKTSGRRNQQRIKLARIVNGRSPVKVVTTKRETGKAPGAKKTAAKAAAKKTVKAKAA